LAVSFVIFTIAISLLNMQMFAMLSRRRADFMFWRLIIGTALSIPLLLIFLQGLPGFRAAFLAFNLPGLLIFLVSSVYITPSFFNGYRFFGQLNRGVTQQLIQYAGANYIATLLWEIPVYVLPIIAASVISAEAAAYFYMPWIIGMTVLSISQLVSLSLFAEGARDQRGFFSLVRKAFLLIAIIVIPMIIVLWFWGNLILSMIGKDYVNVVVIRIILISIVPYSINLIFVAYLRVNSFLKALIAFSLVMSTAVVSLAYYLASTIGSIGLAIGWLSGQTIASVSILVFYGFNQLRSRSSTISA